MKTSKFKIQVACAAGWYDLKESVDGAPYTVELFDTARAARAEKVSLRDVIDSPMRIVSADEREDWSPYPTAGTKTVAASMHTPGPWTAELIEKSDGLPNQKIYHDDHLIACVAIQDPQCDGGRALGIEAANARLIASAPELLSECRYALAALEGTANPAAAIKGLRAAIAKATIGTPARRVITAQDWEWDKLGVCSDRPSVTVCEWPDRTGYYEQSARGEYVATVSNASESFATADACEAWLYANLESKH